MKSRTRSSQMWKPAKKEITQRELISPISLEGFEMLTKPQLASLVSNYVTAILERTSFKRDADIKQPFDQIIELSQCADINRLRNAFYLIVQIVVEWDKFNAKEKEEKRAYKPFPPVEHHNMARWLEDIAQALNPEVPIERQDRLPYRPVK